MGGKIKKNPGDKQKKEQTTEHHRKPTIHVLSCFFFQKGRMLEVVLLFFLFRRQGLLWPMPWTSPGITSSSWWVGGLGGDRLE
jgi:hypothetical protein